MMPIKKNANGGGYSIIEDGTIQSVRDVIDEIEMLVSAAQGQIDIANSNATAGRWREEIEAAGPAKDCVDCAVIGDVMAWQATEDAFAEVTPRALLLHIASEVGELAQCADMDMLHGDVDELKRRMHVGMTPSGQTNHSDEEIADIFILLIHLAQKLGVDLIGETSRKLIDLRAREWKVADKDGVVEHVSTSKAEDRAVIAVKQKDQNDAG